MCGPFSPGPEGWAGDLASGGDYGVSKINLLVELERARCKCNGAGSCSRLIDLVDDSNWNAEFGEPQREHEPRGPRTDDQNRYFSQVGHFLRGDNVKVGAEARWN